MAILLKTRAQFGIINQNALKIQFFTFYSTEKKAERTFFKNQEVKGDFKVFDVYLNKQTSISPFTRRARKKYVKSERDPNARYLRMPIDQDWTNLWPTSAMFNQATVPLPVRQGFVRNNSENNGLPPEKYANTELMKIPNFLHLTPPHIKKQCAAIKKFCTPWPEQLKTDEDCEKHFPIEISTSTYLYDGPSLRDDRSRVVKLEINVDSLNLPKREKEKFKKLGGERYNPETNKLTLVTDACPYRNQNEDYANYLLTTLYFESKNFEEWESEITEDDRSEYIWSESRSKKNIVEAVKKIEKKDIQDESILQLESVNKYKENLTKLFEDENARKDFSAYKNSVLELLKLNQPKQEQQSK